jgi:predicted molibdopterin-dependent oxidoreductase YjgC
LFVEELQLTNTALESPWEEPGTQDDLLLRADRHPNRRGACEIGFTGDAKAILEKAASGQIRVLYVFWYDFAEKEAIQLMAKVDFLVFQGVNWNSTAEMAKVVLPGATHAEKEGTFTNFEGRIQRFKQAFLPIEEARAESEILTQLAERLGHPVSCPSPEEAFVRWQGFSYEALGEFGLSVEREPAIRS